MSQQTVGFIEYTAQGGDTFDSIALAAYNEERMASTIIAANPDLSDVLIFEGGELVQIPIVEAVTTPDTLPPWRR
ncbi:MAG: LysM domain-containing protein [Oscillospiraceae bacterium]|jgi:phage tail protein X